MIFGARFGTLTIIAGLVLGASQGLAQAETSGTWTDPPVRGAAEQKPADAAKPTEKAAAPEKAEPSPAKPVETASGPEKGRPVASERQRSASAARPTHRSAKLRREHIRVAAQSRPVAEAPLRRPHYGRVARAHEQASARHAAHRRFGERRLYAYRPFRSEQPRYTRREAMPNAEDGGVPTYGARRAGWGGLIGDNPEDRIAQARAAGYLVVRSRTYSYSDGTRVRELTPYSPFGLE